MRRNWRLWAPALLLALALVPALTISAAAANTDGSGGITITDSTGDTTYTLGGGQGGTATWSKDAKTLTFDGTGTVESTSGEALTLPSLPDCTLAAEENADITLRTSGENGSYSIWARTGLNIRVEAGASLTVENTTTGGGPVAIHAGDGPLDIEIAEGGTLRAVSTKPRGPNPEDGTFHTGGAALNAMSVAIRNRGTLSLHGSGFGISASETVSLDGAGITLVSGGGRGIRCFGPSVTIRDNVRGMVAGGQEAVRFYNSSGGALGTFTNDALSMPTLDGASAALLEAMKAGTFAPTDVSYDGGLDLHSAAPALYNVGRSGLALWDTGGGSHSLQMCAVSIKGLKLPAGSTAVTLRGGNFIFDGVAVEAGAGNRLSFSFHPASIGVIPLGVKAPAGGLPFTGVSQVDLAAPPAGQVTESWVMQTGGGTYTVPGSAFRDAANGGRGGVYVPAAGDEEFRLECWSMADLDGKYVLTVEEGHGGGVDNGRTASVSLTAGDAGPFFGWERFDPATGRSLGTVSTERAFSYPLTDLVTALRPLREPPRPAPEPEPGEDGGDEGPSTYTVVYQPNYPGGPAALRDGGYERGDTVKARGADAFPAPAGLVFAGWAETAEGPVRHRAGGSFQMPARTVTLYAVWVRSGTFGDIAGHWAEEDIRFVVSRGLLNGTSAAAFSPDRPVTRAMFVTALHRLAGCPRAAGEGGAFTDVPLDAYYAEAVRWAAEQGIVSGTTETTFSPDIPISRQQMAAMLHRFAQAMGWRLPAVGEAAVFKDQEAIAPWAKEAVEAMQRAGVLNGRADGRFDPAGAATRAQAAAVLRRFAEAAKTETGLA